MIFGSVCSGIEAASVAWHPLGWRAAFLSEIDAFPRAVLQHHYPHVPLHGDFTTIKEGDYAAIDLLVGGTPCQAFSVAGLRKGFADERGNLTLEFVRLAQRLRPRWLVWENVPGVLSIDGGRAFGSFLGGLAELGYGFAYRVLDAQHFGVPQRRRRVFVVGYFGDWRPPAAVLFESESLRRDLTPRRKARESVAGTLASRTSAGGGLGTDMELDGGLIAFGGNNMSGSLDVATAVNAHGGPHGRLDFESETFVTRSFRAEGCDSSEDGIGRGTPFVPVAFSCKDHGADAGVTAPTLRAMGHSGSHANAGGQLAVAQPYTLAIRGREDAHRLEYRQDGTANAILTPNGGRAGIGVGAVAIPINMQSAVKNGVKSPNGTGIGEPGDPAPTLGANDQHAVAFAQNTRDELRYIGGDGQVVGALAAEPGMKQQSYIQQAMQVRRLTPRECERLQGFPDDYTQVSHRGKPAADGPRYKALGNSMAVPCMRHIGERINEVEALLAA